MTGAAFMIDEKTIVLAGGFIEKSLENIQATSKATFMPWNPAILSNEYWKHYEKTGEKQSPAGYRFYCTVKPDSSDDFQLSEIKQRFNKSGRSRIAEGLTYTITFLIDEIREIEF